MRSKFAIGGHPLHPMLIALPIGLFAWAIACDFIYLFTGKDELWYDMSLAATVAGVITALVAALPGFGDYFTMAKDTPARGMATAHMALNLAVVAIFAVSALLMYDDNATDGGAFTLVMLLHLLGGGMLALSGWLGGEMVYRYHLAVVPDEEMQREGTHPRQAMRPGTRPR